MRKVNRLLMGVSTLSINKGVMSSSVYTWKGQVRYAGYSQLEPIIQMFYETKCQDPEDTLELILLCTKKVLDGECTFTMNHLENNEKENVFSEAVKRALSEGETVSSGESPVIQKKYTAVDYLIHRVKYYVIGNTLDMGKEQIGCQLLQSNDKQYIYRFPEDCVPGKERLRFVLIAIDEMNPEDGMKTAFEYLKKNKIDGEFWIATHGGYREIFMIMMALVSLLRVGQIVPNRVLGVQFDKEKNRIVEQKQMIDINLFVAGMEEFINHGSTEILKQYYQRYYGDAWPEKTKSWLDAMNGIADGTRLCDTGKILKGIQELKDMCRDYENKSASEKENGQVEDKYFDIFVDYIRSDYGDLLTDQEISYLKVVQRCCKKKLYQQALTFVEACMPKYFCDKKLIYFKESKERIKEWRKDSKNYYEKDNNVFLFNRYMGFMKNKLAKDKKNWIWVNNVMLEQLKNIDKVVVQWPNDMEYCTCLNSLSEVERQNSLKILENILKLHKTLKICRNHYNHANSDEKLELEQVAKALDSYTAMVEKLETAMPTIK